MGNLLTNPDFWRALTSLAWPIVVLAMFLLMRDKIMGLFSKDNLSIKVAGMEISVADAAKNIGEQVADLQKRLASLEEGKPSSTSQPAKAQKSAVATNEKKKKNAHRNSPSGAAGMEQNSQAAILWVDDFPSNNAFIVDQFQKQGIEVKLSLSTKTALEAMQSNDFDLIISDLGREEDGVKNSYAGLDLVKKVRKIPSNIPILIYAGQRGVDNRGKLISAGATDVAGSAVEVQKFVFHHLRRKRA